MVATFKDLVERWSSSDMKEPLAAGFFGVLVGIVADTHQETATLAAGMHLLNNPDSPDDVLPIIAKDRRLPRYYLETAAQHRDRLWNAWDIYAKGGSERAVVDELDAAGWGPALKAGVVGASGIVVGAAGYMWGDRGTRVHFRPFAPGPRAEPPPYWSQYWITFGPGMHPIIGPPIPWGDFTWGDTYDGVWGPLGYSDDFKRAALGIVRKWKPPRWVFRGFRFILLGIRLGDPDFVVGASGTVWGDVIEAPVPIS